MTAESDDGLRVSARMTMDAPVSAHMRREQLVSELTAAREWEQVTVAVTQGVNNECLEHVLLAALKDCQWACVTQVLHQGVSLQLRDQVMMEAVRHSQWPCVSTLITLGVSAGHRDTAFLKGARYNQWEMVDRLLALGVSEKQRDASLQRAIQHQQWDFVSSLLQAGISQQQRDHALSTALDNELWRLANQLVKTGVSQQHRDAAAQKAVLSLQQAGQPTVTAHDELWQLVSQLTETGISLQERNLAVKAAVQHGQWQLVSGLVQAGVSPKEREHAVRAAVVQQQWSSVEDLLKAGVTVKDVVRLELWEQLPKVVALCDDRTQVEHAVKKAIKQCQWRCVTRLVPLGLSEEVKERLLDEAVEWGHVDCAIEVLRQGVSEEEQQRIVHMLYRHRKWHHVVDLLREKTLPTAMIGFILHGALAYSEFDAFMSIVQLHCVTDRTLSQAMTVAVCACLYSLLHNIIRTTRSGLRVFKQLCFKQHWTGHATVTVVRTLCEAREMDLALYLAATHHLWDIVLDLYNGDHVTNSTRRVAFMLAVRHGAWSHVPLMVQRNSCDVTGARERRLAFLGAVRQGRWRVALQLGDQRLSLSNSDVKFAIQTCLSNGQWEFVTEYYRGRTDIAARRSLIKFAIQTCVKDNLLNCFLSLSHSTKNRELLPWLASQVLELACDTALQADRCDYVLSLCIDDGDRENPHYWRTVRTVAIESSIKAKRWNLMLELAQDQEDQFSYEHFMLCIRKIIKTRGCRHKCVPFLNAWCKDAEPCLQEIFYEWWDIDMNQTSPLVKWCVKNDFGNLALFVALLSRNWPLVRKVADELKHKIDRGVIIRGVEFALHKSTVDTTVCLLQYTDVEDLHIDLDYVSFEDTRNLLEKCQQKEMYTWAVQLAVSWEVWDVADKALENCQHKATINKAIHEAVYSSLWDLIRRHVDKSSLDEDELCTILRHAVSEGDTDAAECVSKLLEKVDPESATVASSSLINLAFEGSDDEGSMLRLCIRAGLSAHHRQLDPILDSPMRQALENCNLPLVRLLYESGCCSNRELYELKTDAALRGELERQGQGEMCHYLDHAASNPLSLQNLSRLTVSRLLSCRPGRRDRVASLHVAWCLKDYLSFDEF